MFTMIQNSNDTQRHTVQSHCLPFPSLPSLPPTHRFLMSPYRIWANVNSYSPCPHTRFLHKRWHAVLASLHFAFFSVPPDTCPCRAQGNSLLLPTSRRGHHRLNQSSPHRRLSGSKSFTTAKMRPWRISRIARFTQIPAGRELSQVRLLGQRARVSVV